MRTKPSHFGFTPQEHRISALPSTVASVIVLVLTMLNGSLLWPVDPLKARLLSGLGMIGIAYIIVLNILVLPNAAPNPFFNWLNAFVTPLELGLLTFTVSAQLDIYIGVLLILAVISSSITSERGPSYTMILLSAVTEIFVRQHYGLRGFTLHISIMLIAIITVETVGQLKNLSRSHIRRLEIITEFSRQIASSLNAKQVMSLLNAALQNAVKADTYFVGIREGSEMRLELIYDDGKYYENQRTSLDGSLSGRVFENHESLFLPDLRKEVRLPGVRIVLIGKHKTSLSWMGVPMRSGSVDGIIVIGSYRPNAFNRADLELLSSLALHAAQALHNAYDHAGVELQAQLDSLTGVYNHGHFLKILKEQADQTLEQKQSLSLIMLDVDHFKLYNDTYGHLIGDEILTRLCNVIKQHIKATDAVGRWGGEEFAISLPNAGAEHALQIAERIQQTMLALTVYSDNEKSIPGPTVSQGFAIYPIEADDAIKLIDLADKRLYIAKERGRNQIEPNTIKQTQNE
ncbi:MAG: GGDEF domain-containing protein [Chloroflexi bacterium]|nr:GGDEF domain-containing protein [Chloroflexota bacterium]